MRKPSAPSWKAVRRLVANLLEAPVPLLAMIGFARLDLRHVAHRTIGKTEAVELQPVSLVSLTGL